MRLEKERERENLIEVTEMNETGRFVEVSSTDMTKAV